MSLIIINQSCCECGKCGCIVRKGVEFCDRFAIPIWMTTFLEWLSMTQAADTLFHNFTVWQCLVPDDEPVFCGFDSKYAVINLVPMNFLLSILVSTKAI